MKFKIYLIIFIGMIFSFFLIILFYGQYSPNLSNALGIIAISSPFIILLYHIMKEKEREKENLYLLKNRVARIINHIYNKRNEIGEIPNNRPDAVNFTKRRKEIRNNIKNFISKLSDFGLKLLNLLKVEIVGIKLESFEFLKKYRFTPSGLREKNQDGLFDKVVFTREKRDEILSELNNLKL